MCNNETSFIKHLKLFWKSAIISSLEANLAQPLKTLGCADFSVWLSGLLFKKLKKIFFSIVKDVVSADGFCSGCLIPCRILSDIHQVFRHNKQTDNDSNRKVRRRISSRNSELFLQGIYSPVSPAAACAVKQVVKWASIWSFVRTKTGLE